MNAPVHIIQGGADATNGDYGLVHKLARNGKTYIWACPKNTQSGDRLLIYFQQPHSEIVAVAQALSGAVPGEYWRYEAKIGRVQLLPNRIGLDEMRKRFPRWGWPRYPRGSTYLDDHKAKWFWTRAMQPPAPQLKVSKVAGRGAGFGEAETNALVERAAVQAVRRQLVSEGYKIVSRERERIGYDLDATRDGTTLHIEVKGISGLLLQFPITGAEVKKSTSDAAFRLFAVTEARTKRPKIHRFGGREFIKRFALTPVCYIAQATRPPAD